MVRVVPNLVFIAGFVLFLSSPLCGKDISDYRLGDKVAENIVTPVTLVVVDPEATDALKLKEAQRFPVIVRFDLTTLNKVEDDLHEAFAYYRSNFLNAVEATFNHRKLDEAAIALPKFQSAIASFRRHHAAFPLSTNLAESWARGDSESVESAALISRVRKVMAHHIRPDAWPDNLRLGQQVRLVTVSNSAEAITLEIADARGVNTSHASLVTLARARAELQSGLAIEELALARFAAIWLRPNCYLDVEMTKQDRARRTDALYAADHYEAGQTVARAGQVVDAKILAALKQLDEKSTGDRLQHQVVAEHARAIQARWRNRWLMAALAVAALLLAVTFWRRVQRRRILSMLPAEIASGYAGAAVSCPSCEQIVGSTVESWQQRVVVEKTVEAAHAAIRAGVLPQLVQFLRLKLVRGLVLQRGQLIEGQQSAADEMTAMERRLDELRTPLRERLRAYEKRISELESALAAKGEENRELIIAKILLMRQQLEAERARNRVVLN